MRFAYSCNSSLSNTHATIHQDNSFALDNTSCTQESALNAALQSGATTCTDAPINTVIFDMDGTILDTLHDLATAVNYALVTNGCAACSKHQVRAYLGNGARNLIKQCVGNGAKPELYTNVFETFCAYYATHHAEKTSPYEGIISLLKHLKQAHIKLGVLSNKPDCDVRALVDTHFADCFDAYAGASDAYPLKPAADHVFAMMTKLDTTPQHCLYVGDSEVDIQTARNAHCRCASVSWGFRDKDELIRLGTNPLCSSVEELKAYIDKYISTQAK